MARKRKADAPEPKPIDVDVEYPPEAEAPPEPGPAAPEPAGPSLEFAQGALLVHAGEGDFELFRATVDTSRGEYHLGDWTPKDAPARLPIYKGALSTVRIQTATGKERSKWTLAGEIQHDAPVGITRP